MKYIWDCIYHSNIPVTIRALCERKRESMPTEALLRLLKCSLRCFFFSSPMWSLSSYRWLQMLSTHTQTAYVQFKIDSECIAICCSIGMWHQHFCIKFSFRLRKESYKIGNYLFYLAKSSSCSIWLWDILEAWWQDQSRVALTCFFFTYLSIHQWSINKSFFFF